MLTLTPEQFKAKYGQAGLDSFQSVAESNNNQPEQKLTDIVGQDIATRVQRVGEIQSRTDTGAVTKAVQTFGQGVGLAANTLEQTAMQVPGVKQVAQGVGEGINWLATSDISPIKHLGDVIGSNKTLQTAVKLYDTDQNFKDTIDAVANIVRLGGDVQMAVDSANFTANVTNKVIRGVKDTTVPVIESGVQKVKGSVDETIQNAPENIMNRVARLNPKDANSFKEMTGKTHGQYLSDTGNFGTPEEVIAKEAEKFVTSMKSVDAEFAKMEGVFKNGAIKDMLKGLIEKTKAVSSPNVKAPYHKQVIGWIKKYNNGGLSMEDINLMKRLYEREVKLGYNKLMNADKVAQATNIDSAVRKWQFKQAKDMGFENVDAMNKQTQASRFLVNKLGDKIIGQSGLNSVSLTDWIMLAGANPNAVAGFLTKRFFSSKSVQANIAKYLKGGDIQDAITPQVKTTRATQTSLPESKIIPEKALPKSIPQSTAKSKSLPKEDALATEARKYKTAEEFVKAQAKLNHASAGEIKSFVPDLPNQKPIFLTKDSGYYKEHIGSDAKNTPVRVELGKTITLTPDVIKKALNTTDNLRVTQFENANVRERSIVFKWLQDNGYNSAVIPKDWNRGNEYIESTVVFNPSKQILTRSQLIDIWNKAHKK